MRGPSGDERVVAEAFRDGLRHHCIDLVVDGGMKVW